LRDADAAMYRGHGRHGWHCDGAQAAKGDNLMATR
jgi:hypothetical protein